MRDYESGAYSEVVKGDCIEKCVANRVIGFEFVE